MRHRHNAVDDDTDHDDGHADDDSTLDVHPHLEQPGVSNDDGRYNLEHDARHRALEYGREPGGHRQRHGHELPGISMEHDVRRERLSAGRHKLHDHDAVQAVSDRGAGGR